MSSSVGIIGLKSRFAQLYSYRDTAVTTDVDEEAQFQRKAK
jgi:hypothetical protein